MSLKPLIHFFATVGYIGHLPKTPGTWGTVPALALVWVLRDLSSLQFALFAFLLMIFAILISHGYEKFYSGHDRKEVVIDEVSGFVFAMWALPVTAPSLMLGFLLFRIIDIFKPFPISWMDKKIKGGLGVVLDDVVAGILCNVILHLWIKIFPGWL